MTARSQTKKLFILDRGVTLEEVARVVGPTNELLPGSVAFLDTPSLGSFESTGSALVAEYIGSKIPREAGENLASAAITVANRLANELVDAMQRSS